VNNYGGEPFFPLRHLLNCLSNDVKRPARLALADSELQALACDEEQVLALLIHLRAGLKCGGAVTVKAPQIDRDVEVDNVL